MRMEWLRDTEFRAGEEVVYFVQGEHGGPIKIGYTKQSLPMRLSHLQCGNPYKLVVRRIVSGGDHAEGEIHKRFRRHRLTGEWFSPAPELVELAQASGSDPSEDYRHGYEDSRKDFLRALLRAYGLSHLSRWPDDYRQQLPAEVLEALDGQVDGQAEPITQQPFSNTLPPVNDAGSMP